MIKIIKPKERVAIIQSLKSGVVPRVGLQHIQVGRTDEIKSLVSDIDIIADSGSAFRFIIGDYGSGKTFFIQLVKNIALEKGLVTVNADLSPSKRLHGKNGQARLLFSELISNISTRTKPDGNALENILEKFVSIARDEASANGCSVENVIQIKLSELRNYVGGYDFASVINKYWEGYNTENECAKSNATRWLKAEYSSKLEAYQDLRVRTIINDASFYDSLKLFSILVKQAGYKGFLICMDEMVNLYKIANTISRRANYEEILRMLNDSLQGTTSHIGFVMGGTPDFLTDNHRGLYSYDALKSRLSENSFAKQLGVTDYNSTAMRLANLTQEEVYLLLKNIRNVYANGKEENYLVPDEALVAYLRYCSEKIGESYFRTPRNTIKGFIDLLSTLEQHSSYNWTDIIEKIDITVDQEDSEMKIESVNNNADDEFASLKL